MKNNGKQKINWLLILQGWAMLWVVIGHAGPSNYITSYPSYARIIYNTAYSFHMPLFITVSGFLFYITRLNSKKWTYYKMLGEKLTRFGIPFVVFTLFGMVIKTIFSADVERPSSLTIGEFLNAILYPGKGPVGEFWFLGVIMWMFALYPIWKIVLNSWVLSSMAMGATIIMFFVHPQTEFLSIDMATSLSSFFVIGLILGKVYSNYDLSNHQSIRYTLILILCSLIFYTISRYLSILYLLPLFGILTSVGIAFILDRYKPQSFSSFRNYTFQIYLIGLWAQMLVKLIRLKLDLPFLPMYIISVVLGLYFSVMISKLIERLNWLPLLLCIGLKKKH